VPGEGATQMGSRWWNNNEGRSCCRFMKPRFPHHCAEDGNLHHAELQQLFVVHHLAKLRLLEVLPLEDDGEGADGRDLADGIEGAVLVGVLVERALHVRRAVARGVLHGSNCVDRYIGGGIK